MLTESHHINLPSDYLNSFSNKLSVRSTFPEIISSKDPQQSFHQNGNDETMSCSLSSGNPDLKGGSVLEILKLNLSLWVKTSPCNLRSRVRVPLLLRKISKRWRLAHIYWNFEPKVSLNPHSVLIWACFASGKTSRLPFLYSGFSFRGRWVTLPSGTFQGFFTEKKLWIAPDRIRTHEKII